MVLLQAQNLQMANKRYPQRRKDLYLAPYQQGTRKQIGEINPPKIKREVPEKGRHQMAYLSAWNGPRCLFRHRVPKASQVLAQRHLSESNAGGIFVRCDWRQKHKQCH